MTRIIDTGERILPESESSLMTARHMCAYRFAQKFVQGKDILDIGCGEGYGVNYLAPFAKSALGVDYSQEAINFAQGKYRLDNLTYQVCRVQALDKLTKRFDLITSFQVIEHIPDPGQFLNQVKLLLKEGGVFVCSTPNRLDSSPGSSIPFNKFHLREYLFCEFDALLRACFSGVNIFGLKRGLRLNFFRRLKKIGICNLLPKPCNPVNIFFKHVNCGHFVIIKEKVERTLDFIAVCSG